MSGDKTPRGGEEKPNFVVIDLTGVNIAPGKNVYSLTFKVRNCNVITIVVTSITVTMCA